MWNSVWVNSESDITNKNREMSQITHLPFTSCKASVFHKSTRSQLDWQKSYTEQRICIDEKFIFVPYKKKTGILDILPEMLKVDYIYIWLCVNCKDKTLKYINKSFSLPSECEAKKKKKQLSLHLKHITAWMLQGHKIYLLFLQLKFSIPLNLNRVGVYQNSISNIAKIL